jgi:uncharacterized spore protein YtfJ
MSDGQNKTPEMEDQLEFYQSDPAIIAIEDTLDTFLSAATVEAVYGEPVEHEGSLIIPMAEVLSGVGFGMGYGYGKTANGEEEEQESNSNNIGSGGGGGGGGRVLSRPVGVIIASQEGVRVEPVVDVTKIALAALTAAGFMTAMMMRMASPRKALKNLKID